MPKRAGFDCEPRSDAWRLLKLDQTKINPDGVKYANLEPCDFFSDKKQFIHLKDGHSSGPISHLWSQGAVSAEAFVSDPGFRKKLRAKVRSLGPGFESYLPKAAQKVAREEYSVVYGIMRKPYSDGSLDLPFFSKVSLQAAAERIGQFGIPLAIELIEKPGTDEAREDSEDENRVEFRCAGRRPGSRRYSSDRDGPCWRLGARYGLLGLLLPSEGPWSRIWWSRDWSRNPNPPEKRLSSAIGPVAQLVRAGGS